MLQKPQRGTNSCCRFAGCAGRDQVQLFYLTCTRGAVITRCNLCCQSKKTLPQCWPRSCNCLIQQVCYHRVSHQLERDEPHIIDIMQIFSLRACVMLALGPRHLWTHNVHKENRVGAGIGNLLLRKAVWTDLMPQWKLGSALRPLLNRRLLTHSLHIIINTHHPAEREGG